MPSKDMMLADIEHKKVEMAERFMKSSRHTIQVDYVPFMDELAAEIGCKADIGKVDCVVISGY